MGTTVTKVASARTAGVDCVHHQREPAREQGSALRIVGCMLLRFSNAPVRWTAGYDPVSVWSQLRLVNAMAPPARPSTSPLAVRHIIGAIGAESRPRGTASASRATHQRHQVLTSCRVIFLATTAKNIATRFLLLTGGLVKFSKDLAHGRGYARMVVDQHMGLRQVLGVRHGAGGEISRHVGNTVAHCSPYGVECRRLPAQPTSQVAVLAELPNQRLLTGGQDWHAGADQHSPHKVAQESRRVGSSGREAHGRASCLCFKRMREGITPSLASS